MELLAWPRVVEQGPASGAAGGGGDCETAVSLRCGGCPWVGTMLPVDFARFHDERRLAFVTYTRSRGMSRENSEDILNQAFLRLYPRRSVLHAGRHVGHQVHFHDPELHRKRFTVPRWEQAALRWRRLGRPGRERFTLQVTPDGTHRVGVAGTDREWVLTWPEP